MEVESESGKGVPTTTATADSRQLTSGPMPSGTGLMTLLAEAGQKWWDDDAPRMGAALAYYTLFSLAPLLVVAVVVAGVVFGEAAAQGQLMGHLEQVVGHAGAQAIQDALANVDRPGVGTGAGLAATIGSLALSTFAASGVFNELRRGLDTAWASSPEPRSTFTQGVVEYLVARVWTFLIVLGVGCVLLLSLIGSVFLQRIMYDSGSGWDEWHWLGNALDFVASMVVVTLLFGTLYKVLPATRVTWADVWPGALTAAVLFWIGRILIGTYLRHSSVASVYGAAGSLVVVMIWTWFSALVLLYGAETCHVYARRRGRVVGRQGRRRALGPVPAAAQGTIASPE